jgi:hypothetical protein
MADVYATQKSERVGVFFACLLGAVHVFVFAAAFPFFGVADEQTHFDLAVRYAHGEFPRTLTPPAAEALPFLAVYGTPEYLSPPSALPGGVIPPPPWKQPLEKVRDKLAAKEAAYQQQFKNHEAASPPLYYGLAGGWWRLGQALRFEDNRLLYWLRFLNIPLVALLVWLGWRTAREVFPENRFIRAAVPLFIALLPQTAFYTINNDLLTALTFGAAFIFLLKWSAVDNPPAKLSIATGLALAAAYLTKTSNLPLLAAAGIFMLVRTAIRLRRDAARRPWSPLLLVLLAAGLPMAAWAAWCQINFGDFTGSSPKIHFLGWTDQPARFWLAHPIFTGPGCWYFIRQNLATFWQGEMLWQRQPLAMPAVDLVYVVLTLGALALALVALLRRPPPFTTAQISALWLAWLCVVAVFVFFAVLSVKFDFRDCFYPSRQHPFFVSGRLLLGMLVPFLILVAAGLDRLMKTFESSTRSTLLFTVLAFMLASEISIDLPVFASEYNWFHLFN